MNYGQHSSDPHGGEHTTIVIAMRYWGEGRSTDNTNLELKSSNENGNEGYKINSSIIKVDVSFWGGGRDNFIARLLLLCVCTDTELPEGAVDTLTACQWVSSLLAVISTAYPCIPND